MMVAKVVARCHIKSTSLAVANTFVPKQFELLQLLFIIMVKPSKRTSGPALQAAINIPG